MDQAAKITGQKYKQTRIQPCTACWANHENYGSITKKSTTVKHWLLEHTCRQAAREYWSNKPWFRGMDIESIDWLTIQSVVTSMTIKKRWITKFTTGFCTTGQMMQQWGLRESASCPWCNHKTETTGHILQCPNTTTQEIGDRNTKELRATLPRDRPRYDGRSQWRFPCVELWPTNPPPQYWPTQVDFNHLSCGTTLATDLLQSAGRLSNSSTMTINNFGSQAQNGPQKCLNGYSNMEDNNGTIKATNYTDNNQIK